VFSNVFVLVWILDVSIVASKKNKIFSSHSPLFLFSFISLLLFFPLCFTCLIALSPHFLHCLVVLHVALLHHTTSLHCCVLLLPCYFLLPHVASLPFCLNGLATIAPHVPPNPPICCFIALLPCTSLLCLLCCFVPYVGWYFPPHSSFAGRSLE